MTVEQLIEALRKYDPKLMVACPDLDGLSDPDLFLKYPSDFSLNTFVTEGNQKRYVTWDYKNTPVLIIS